MPLPKEPGTISSLLRTLLRGDNRLEVEVYRRHRTNASQESEGVQLTIVQPHDQSLPFVWSELRVNRQLQSQDDLIVHQTPQTAYRDFVSLKESEGYTRRASYTVHTEPGTSNANQTLNG